MGGQPFTHPAVFYRDTPGYLAATVPFVLGGHTLDEPVAVAVPGPNLRVIQQELAARGGRVDQVRWLDMTDAGRNPGQIIPSVLRAFADRHAGRRVRIIGEPIWAGRSHDEYSACVQHEALINAAFAGLPATILCPYDAQRLLLLVLADAAATHPILVDADPWRHQWRRSRGYAPAHIVDTYNQPLPVPATAREFRPVATGQLSRVRDWAARLAWNLGLLVERIHDIMFVVNELVTNSIEHGTGTPRVWSWTTDTALIFQTVNLGHLNDPLVGRRPAVPGQARGRGVLAVNALADLVRVHTTRDHVTFRVYFHRW
jgi:MEDS: MEthanogen/methylotroph, DcmR Sensory domain/Histidine kinase-like ATPase domain